MPSPLALVLHDDAAARDAAREALSRAGIPAVAVASPREALDVLRAHPAAVVTLVNGGLTTPQISNLKSLLALRAQETPPDEPKILGRSDASAALRRGVEQAGRAGGPVLFWGESGSGRTYAARCVHEASSTDEPLAVVRPGDEPPRPAALSELEGTLVLQEIDRLNWADQEALASAIPRARVRVVATTSLDPRAAAEEGRISRALVAAFGDAVVRVPALRERAADVPAFVRSFIDEVCRLNGLAPIALDAEAGADLSEFAWPGNVPQLRSAVESAVILSEGGAVRARDLPEYVRRGGSPAAEQVGADRKFRDAKRTVVEAFERAYLEDLLKRHRGNVTGAAEQSGMLRSALQRLLRKHELHSADFRSRAAPVRTVS